MQREQNRSFNRFVLTVVSRTFSHKLVLPAKLFTISGIKPKLVLYYKSGVHPEFL